MKQDHKAHEVKLDSLGLQEKEDRLDHLVPLDHQVHKVVEERQVHEESLVSVEKMAPQGLQEQEEKQVYFNSTSTNICCLNVT